MAAPAAGLVGVEPGQRSRDVGVRRRGLPPAKKRRRRQGEAAKYYLDSARDVGLRLAHGATGCSRCAAGRVGPAFLGQQRSSPFPSRGAGPGHAWRWRRRRASLLISAPGGRLLGSARGARWAQRRRARFSTVRSITAAAGRPRPALGVRCVAAHRRRRARPPWRRAPCTLFLSTEGRRSVPGAPLRLRREDALTPGAVFSAPPWAAPGLARCLQGGTAEGRAASVTR